MRRIAVVVVALALAAACSDGGGGSDAAPTTTTAGGTATTLGPSLSTSTTAAATTTTAPPPIWAVAGVVPSWEPIPTEGTAGAVVTPAGIVLPVTGGGPGAWQVQTPCSLTATVAGEPIFGADVVIDPGHGGEEPGAVGPAGLVEKELNFAIADDLAAMLRAAGATVVLTRTADYRITLATRGAIAVALHPQVFISIHHNADPDGPWPGPGSETYYQIASADSKRLAGLTYEEVARAFASYDIDWVADTDAGAKYRPATDGGDYYGILRRTAGVPAVLSEAAFISNAPEEALLATPEFRQVEAGALARAIIRFVGTADPGSGFTTPYPRTVPAGPGGGSEGCDDPPLG